MLILKNCKLIFVLFFLFFAQLTLAQTMKKDSTITGIEWHNWSDTAFEKAEKEGKMVLLDIGAEWCQFCKKMEQVTYQDPQVVKIINENYIAIKADIETTEGVRIRYENFGVPGTIVLTPEGKEINKRLGYIEPLHMQWHLLGVLQDV
jgi:uncharacterized protein YyaL (SSP411 family)